MARQLFIDDRLSNDYLALVEKHKACALLEFWKKTFSPLEFLVKEQIENCAPSANFLSTLYFLGSFSRGVAGLNSDLDLMSLSGDEAELESFNIKMREVFRNYSLKAVSSVEEFVKVSDPKGLLSGWFLKPIFGGKDIQVKMQTTTSALRLDDLEVFLKTEDKKRRKRYGERPGRINYNVKYGPGGAMDLLLLAWRRSLAKEDVDLYKQALFLYKAKTLFHSISDSESLQLVDVGKYAKSFGLPSEQDFFQKFFTTVHGISKALEVKKTSKSKYSVKNLLGGVASLEEISHAEVELTKVRGYVLSPSYHIWTVDQHILTCILETQNFIEEYKEKLSLNAEDQAILQWAAFFHDLKKGGEESHSVLGAQAVQDFGARHGWDPARIELVSWLVREHLTFVKNSFKTDPHHEDFVKNLALRGCEGRRARLLFVLTCADIKATNPATWSEWKRGILERALDRVLGVKETLKEDLTKELKRNEVALAVLEGLSVKEISMVPSELLLSDLKSLGKEGIAFYELDDRFWVRAYFNQDEFGFAEKFINSFIGVGAYIHHAVFKTLQTQGGIKEGAVYNWVCVESGVSFTAFKNRFSVAFKNYKESQAEEILKDVEFRRIRKTFTRANYAVISFKGTSHRGALVSAIKTLKEAGLNIEWGHAVRWGEETEDVFGVSFPDNPDWTFLT